MDSKHGTVCLSTTKRALKSLQLDYVFPDENAMKKIMAMFPISFVPGLLETLQSATPPTIGYFKTLPLTLSLPLSQLWAGLQATAHSSYSTCPAKYRDWRYHGGTQMTFNWPRKEDCDISASVELGFIY